LAVPVHDDRKLFEFLILEVTNEWLGGMKEGAHVIWFLQD